MRSIVLHGWTETKSDCVVEIQQFCPYMDKNVFEVNLIFKGNKVIILNTIHQDILRAIHYCHTHLDADICLNRAK